MKKEKKVSSDAGQQKIASGKKGNPLGLVIIFVLIAAIVAGGAYFKKQKDEFEEVKGEKIKIADELQNKNTELEKKVNETESAKSQVEAENIAFKNFINSLATQKIPYDNKDLKISFSYPTLWGSVLVNKNSKNRFPLEKESNDTEIKFTNRGCLKNEACIVTIYLLDLEKNLRLDGYEGQATTTDILAKKDLIEKQSNASISGLKALRTDSINSASEFVRKYELYTKSYLVEVTGNFKANGDQASKGLAELISDPANEELISYFDSFDNFAKSINFSK